ncbi:hypothetical protein N7540_009688 [Penicillium herquei]|nr:hypothetical protein N7540_009688 [Penicillium herquei]
MAYPNLDDSCEATATYPLGSLPAEQGLLEHLDSDVIPESSDRDCPQPLPQDIETILCPWRSELILIAAVRLYALRIPLLLRTYYNPDHTVRAADDRLIRSWLQLYMDDSDSMSSLWAYLDDPELLNFGDHGKESLSSTAAGLHFKYASSLLIILDQEAFKIRHARIVLVDCRRNIVRETRLAICRRLFEDIIEDWLDISVTNWLWENSKVGDKYRVDGKFEQEIYEFTAGDWEDPSPED